MRNQNQKIADMVTGMEGTGQHFVLNGEEAHKTLLREQQEKFNTKVDEYVDKFEKHNQALENYAKEISEDMNGLEIMPLGSYVLIKPFNENPFQRVEVTKSGIIVDLGGGSVQTHKNQETGQEEEDAPFIKVGTVIETGPEVKFLKTGDLVFFTVACENQIPFFKQGFVTVNETRIMAVVNSGLTERKNGRG